MYACYVPKYRYIQEGILVSLLKTLAAPFYHTRKDTLQISELTFYYAYDKKFMNKDDVPRILKRGVNQGLIEIHNDTVRPLFDINTVEIPIGYKPSSVVFEVEDPFQQLLDRICKESGIQQEDIIRDMNTIQKEIFDQKIRSDAALIIIAKQHGIIIADLLDAFREKLTKKEGKNT